MNDRDGDSDLYSINELYDPEETTVIDQRADNISNGRTYSANVSYTEPIGKFGQIQWNYTASLAKNDADKKTYDFVNDEGETVTELNSRLTNIFRNDYLSNRGGFSYRYNKMRRLNAMAGLNFQHGTLSSDQEFPRVFQVERTFFNVLPQATISRRMEDGRNFRIEYRTQTNPPSIAQLQNVVNNSNPLFLRSGNSALKQDYQQNLTLRFGKTAIEKGRTFLFFVYGSYVKDYIGNATFLNTKEDSVVVNEIKLAPGQQLTYPVNVTDNWSARAFITYGAPVKVIKSNVNLNTGVNYNRTPAVINDAVNVSHNYTLSQGIVLSSNISKTIDFTISYTGNYTIVKNSVSVQQNGNGNNYFTHVSNLKVSCEPWKGLVLNSNVTNSFFSGLSAELDQNIWLWNAAIGYKLLKNRSLEVKLTAFDLLNQNKSIGRDVTDTFIEDSVTNVLTRYMMLGATYTFRKF
jgi:acetyltransferase-like isoleucine patch superfamily enzyme